MNVLSKDPVIRVSVVIEDQHPTKRSVYDKAIVEYTIAVDLPDVADGDRWITYSKEVERTLKDVARNVVASYGNVLMARSTAVITAGTKEVAK